MAHQEIPRAVAGSGPAPISMESERRRAMQEAAKQVKPGQEMKVGERIREVRKAKRIRQKVLARMVGISPGALTNFEKGRRRISLDWLQKISEALDTPMAYFLPDEKDRNKTTPGDPRERRLLNAWRELGRNEVLKNDFLQLLEHLGKSRAAKKARKRAS